MNPPIRGIHHISAITNHGQKNLDFYTGVLGLRLVKLTVNYDDPTSYHLYYGDYAATLGTLLTFFVWPGGQPGRQGLGQVGMVSFSIPESAFGFWTQRLTHFGIAFDRNKEKKFKDTYLRFKDPDGLILELVADNRTLKPTGQTHPAVPAEHSIRGFHSATLWEDGFEATHAFLTKTFGYALREQSDSLSRYAIENEGRGSFIDVRSAPDFWPGDSGAGTVHHIAFRTPTDADQAAWHARLTADGRNVSPIMNREYFHSIYFHEPGGVLFEIATEEPGMTFNESLEQLGTSLQLPAWHEIHRPDIEAALPPLILPNYVA